MAMMRRNRRRSGGWDEKKHPRVPKGVPGKGGEFTDHPTGWAEKVAAGLGTATTLSGLDGFDTLRAHQQNTLGKVSGAEVFAVDNYNTPEVFKSINDVARNGYQPSPVGMMPHQGKAQASRLVPVLDGLIDRAVLPEDAEVWRGVKRFDLTYPDGLSEGDVFQADAFTSTTFDPDHALRFTGHEAEERTQGVLFKIKVRKGQHGLVLAAASSHIGQKGHRLEDGLVEREMLQPRRVQYRVVGRLPDYESKYVSVNTFTGETAYHSSAMIPVFELEVIEQPPGLPGGVDPIAAGISLKDLKAEINKAQEFRRG